MKKPIVLALAGALVLLASGMSQQRSLKVDLLYEMEGLSGETSDRKKHINTDPE